MRTVTLTMDEQGDFLFLKSESTQVFCALGETRTRRASHILPENFWQRLAFRALRAISFDDSAAAQWTRSWRCVWIVDTRPVGGPILEGRWLNRQDAILAEIEFLNRLFAR